MSTTIDPERLGRLNNMLDRQDILDCMIRFSRGIDRLDRELFLSAFHPDATISGGVFVGPPDKLCDWSFAMHEEGQTATHHDLLNHTCEIDGDVAHTETYYIFATRNRDETNWLAGGRYVDRVERRNGVWRIAFRNNAIEWSGMLPTMPVPFSDVPDINLNGAPSRSKADPSYKRPFTNVRKTSIPG